MPINHDATSVISGVPRRVESDAHAVVPSPQISGSRISKVALMTFAIALHSEYLFM